MIRARSVMLVALLLSGCGFAPVYAPTHAGHANPAATELAAVDVALIPNREGQVLRQDIQERLERFGIAADKRYKLTVGYGLSTDGLGIQPDSSTTFIRITANATWTLATTGTAPKVLTTGRAHAVNGFDVVDQQIFAQQLDQETVQRQLAEAIADQLFLQLGIYFRKQAVTPPVT
jgi:LPS-assembly lipoprotein